MKRWSMALMIALLLGVSFSFGCDDGEETYSIYFQSNRGGNWDIYSVQHDGTLETQVTDHVNDDFYPAVSPAGDKLAFIRSSGNATEIILITIEDGEETDLTTGLAVGTVESLTWYPSGERLLFTLSNPNVASGRSQLYWMDESGMEADGTGMNLLSQDQSYSYSNPRMNAESGEIVVTAAQSPESVDVHVLDSEGGFIRVIPQETFLRPTGEFRGADSVEDYAFFSPNGRDVIMQSNAPARTNPSRSYHLWYVSSQGRRSLDRTPDSPHNSMQPVWSTVLDGSTIVYVSDQDGDNEIYLWNLEDDGSSPIPLTANSADDQHPSWLWTAPDTG